MNDTNFDDIFQDWLKQTKDYIAQGKIPLGEDF